VELELELLEAHVLVILGAVPGPLALDVIAAMAESGHSACKTAIVKLMLLGKVVEPWPGKFTLANDGSSEDADRQVHDRAPEHG
jgi:hypothetical protein